MDYAYNLQEAAFGLEGHAQERLLNPFGGLHMAEIAKKQAWVNEFDTIKEGAIWRLVHTGLSSDEPAHAIEEVVASLQGIICKKDLPPFVEKISSNSSHARFLRQSVTLTGLNTPTFQAVTQNIAEIHALFARAVGVDSLSQCGIVSQFQQSSAIEMSNRFFTSKKDVVSVEPVPLNEDIDPYGFLRKAGGVNLFYGEDNVVNYYECVHDVMGNRKFIPIKPVKFQVGDIVEAQVSFLLTPLRDQKFKSSMILRSLALLDGSYTQKATVTRLTTDTNIIPKPASNIKRKVGYEEEDFANTRFRFSQITVDDLTDKEIVEQKEGQWQALLKHVESEQEIPIELE